MEEDYLHHTRSQNSELRSTMQRFDEAQARTRELQVEFERLFAENQALLQKLLAPCQHLSSSSPSPRASEHDL